MGKPLLISILFCISLLVLGCSQQINQTVEDSIKENNISYSKIINQENYGENGKIVFYTVSNPNDIGIGYLRKTSSGWKCIDGVEHLLFDNNEAIGSFEKLTWFWSYQVRTEDIATEENLIPLFMGLIIDPNIQRVIVKAETGTPFSIKDEISIEAKIIQYQGLRIWYLLNPRDDLMKLGVGPVNVLGLSNNGNIIYSSFK